jgi:hypothetical protein
MPAGRLLLKSALLQKSPEIAPSRSNSFPKAQEEMHRSLEIRRWLISFIEMGFWRTFAPNRCEVRQCIREFLIGHPRIRKHPCARVPFTNDSCALLVGFQMQRLRIAQITRLWKELRDQFGGASLELGQLISTAIYAMAVITDAFPVEDAPSRICIASWLRVGTGLSTG